VILERKYHDDKQRIVAAGINRVSINSGNQMAIRVSLSATQTQDNTLAAVDPTELRLLIAKTI
jgi:hypothetical protein